MINMYLYSTELEYLIGTTTKFYFARHLKIGSEAGRKKNPPRLMPAINRDGHFLLIETVTKNLLAKLINRDGQL